MSLSIKKAAVEISASTTTANAALPAGNDGFIRVVNGTAAMAYWNAGVDNTVAATNANIAVAAGAERIFARDPSKDLYVAVILIAGASAGKVSASLCGTPD